MAFDECNRVSSRWRARMRQSMELTLRWAREVSSILKITNTTVPWREYGSQFQLPTLRNCMSSRRSRLQRLLTRISIRHSARRHGSCSAERIRRVHYRNRFPGYAIGGLSVGEPRRLTREVVEATIQHLPADKPRYLMGVGTPEEIVEYSNLGIDMMDCVLPTRAARHGLLFTSEGKVSIKQARYASDHGPLDANCDCRVCARYSRAYLRHLYASNEVLAQVLNTVHNLTYYLDEMRAVRHSIGLGKKASFLSGDRPIPDQSLKNIRPE